MGTPCLAQGLRNYLGLNHTSYERAGCPKSQIDELKNGKSGGIIPQSSSLLPDSHQISQKNDVKVVKQKTTNGILGQLEEGQCIIVDIVCHGVPSPAIWDEHVNFLKKRYDCDMVDYAFRDKSLGWRGMTTTSTFSNGKKICKTRDLNAYLELYYEGLISRPVCHQCPFASLNRPGDITIGDCWGIETCHPDFDDNKGTSLVMINSEKGNSLFEKITDHMQYIELAEKECIQEQLSKPSLKSVHRGEFWKFYSKHGYEAAIKKYTRFGFLCLIQKKFNTLAKKFLTP